jgi:hypothetical protein
MYTQTHTHTHTHIYSYALKDDFTEEEKQLVLDVLALYKGHVRDTKRALIEVIGAKVNRLGTTTKQMVRQMTGWKPPPKARTIVSQSKKQIQAKIMHEFESDIFINLAFVVTGGKGPSGLDESELTEWRMKHTSDLAAIRKIPYKLCKRVCEETQQSEPWLQDANIQKLRFSNGWVNDFYVRCSGRGKALRKFKGVTLSNDDNAAESSSTTHATHTATHTATHPATHPATHCNTLLFNRHTSPEMFKFVLVYNHISSTS